MQVTTLNKIINLLLVGGFSELVVFIAIWEKYGQTLIKSPAIDRLVELSPLMALALTGIALSVAMFLGAVVEGFAGFATRGFLRTAKSNRSVARFFGRSPAYDRLERWQARFAEAIELHPQFKKIRYRGDLNDTSVATGLFFETASPEHVQWLIRHYSTYDLAAQYITVFLSGFLYFVIVRGYFLTREYWWVWLLVFVVLYVLSNLAIARNVYSYEVAYRHGTITLLRETVNNDSAPEQQKPEPTATKPNGDTEQNENG